MFTTKLTDIVLVGIAKYENDYIKEWLDYHYSIGFDKIFVYDDGDGDVPYLDEMPELKEYINSGRLGVERCGGVEEPQLRMYLKFYKEHNAAWIMYLDIDEFLTFSEKNAGYSIKRFLNQDKFNDAEMIIFSWLLYGDNGHIQYEKRPVLERFTEPQAGAFVNPNTMLVKCCVRGNLTGIGFPNPHSAGRRPEELKTYLPSGKTVEKYNSSYPQVHIEYSDAYIRHFFTKSMEEFLQKKLIRGSACRKDNVKRNVDCYWIANEKTPEKEKVFNDMIKLLETEKKIKYNKTKEIFAAI